MPVNFPAVVPAPLSQILPASQAEWQQMLNQLNSWASILSGASVKWLTPTLLNSWVSTNAGYTQDLTRRVWCRGTLTSGVKTDGTQLLQLPAPPNAVNLVSYGFNGTTISPVGLSVDITGNVTITGASSFTGSYAVSLDQLTYSIVI